MVYVLRVQQPAISLPCLQETLFLTTWIKTSPGVSPEGSFIHFLPCCRLCNWSQHHIPSKQSEISPPLFPIQPTCVWVKKEPGHFREEVTTWVGVVKHIFSPGKHLTVWWNIVKLQSGWHSVWKDVSLWHLYIKIT